MELFSYNIEETLLNGYKSKVDRNNFNTFFGSFLIIFSVLTGENWDATMFQFARSKGYIAIFFFISLIIIGEMIFLNIFLAILLENFDEGEETVDTRNLKGIDSYFLPPKVIEWLIKFKATMASLWLKLERIMDY